MKRSRGNVDLLDKKRFARQEIEYRNWLMNLSLDKAVKLEEKLISSYLIWEWRDNFMDDNPICIKLALKKKNENIIGRCL